jgi:hypothetical protein
MENAELMHRSWWKIGIKNEKMAGGSCCGENGDETAEQPELTPESHIQAFYRPFRGHLEH